MKTTISEMLFSEMGKDIKRLSKKKVTEGDELLIVNKEIFGDDEEHDINFVYGDGIAVSEDKKYILLYTKRENLTEKKKFDISNYDGIPFPRSFTNRDIALFEGAIFYNPFNEKIGK